MLATKPDSGPGHRAVSRPPHARRWAGFRTLQVSDVVEESATVASYYFTSDDDALPPATPGQYLTLRVPGAGDPAPVRTYSLSGDPNGRSYRISVKRESLGLVSSYLHGHLRRGDHVEVAAPRGDFVLDEGTDPVLLISAGIGVTPVLAMLHGLAESHSTREIWWIHTTHDASTHAFADEADALLRSLPSAHSHVHYTARRADPLPAGHRGRTPHRGGRRSAGAPRRRRRVHLRTRVVHGRRGRGPGRRRPRSAADPHGAVRLPIADQPRHRRRGRSPTAPAAGIARDGSRR